MKFVSKLQNKPYSLNIIYFQKIYSTSSYIKDNKYSISFPALCIADIQTSGYGQRGRDWLSSEGDLTFSLAVRFAIPLHELSNISQIIVVAIHKALAKYSMEKLSIKWPNDIYNEQGKIVGCLVETLFYNDKGCTLCIGVGINLQNKYSANFNDNLTGIDTKHKKNIFLDEVLTQLFYCINSRSYNVLSDIYLSYWAEHDWIKEGELVKVNFNKKYFNAIYCGLDSKGRLMLEQDSQFSCYNSGMVSITKISA